MAGSHGISSWCHPSYGRLSQSTVMPSEVICGKAAKTSCHFLLALPREILFDGLMCWIHSPPPPSSCFSSRSFLPSLFLSFILSYPFGKDMREWTCSPFYQELVAGTRWFDVGVVSASDCLVMSESYKVTITLWITCFRLVRNNWLLCSLKLAFSHFETQSGPLVPFLIFFSRTDSVFPYSIFNKKSTKYSHSVRPDHHFSPKEGILVVHSTLLLK